MKAAHSKIKQQPNKKKEFNFDSELLVLLPKEKRERVRELEEECQSQRNFKGILDLKQEW